MAIVVLGGLITSLLVNLIVIPVLYLGFGEVSSEVKNEERAMRELDLITASS